jgi:hypothetical protein
LSGLRPMVRPRGAGWMGKTCWASEPESPISAGPPRRGALEGGGGSGGVWLHVGQEVAPAGKGRSHLGQTSASLSDTRCRLLLSSTTSRTTMQTIMPTASMLPTITRVFMFIVDCSVRVGDAHHSSVDSVLAYPLVSQEAHTTIARFHTFQSSRGIELPDFPAATGTDRPDTSGLEPAGSSTSCCFCRTTVRQL